MNYKLYNGDCLQVMQELVDEGVKVDLVLTDPPYNITKCKWDSIIPFDEMWNNLNLLVKDSTPIVLFGFEPFSCALKMSNIKNHKYDWIWDKCSVSNPQNAKIEPLRNFEVISVFSKNNNRINYFPVGLKKIRKPKIKRQNPNSKTEKLRHIDRKEDYLQEYTNYPKLTISFPRPVNNTHPTQKPVQLLEYLIKTYTTGGEIVLDFTMGSGSTGVACTNTNRDFIGIELDEEYFKIAEKRIKEANVQTKLEFKESNSQKTLV